MKRKQLLLSFLMVVAIASIAVSLISRSYPAEKCLAIAGKLGMAEESDHSTVYRLSTDSETAYGTRVVLNGQTYGFVYFVRLEKTSPDKGELCILDSSLSVIELKDNLLVNTREELRLETKDFDGDGALDVAIKVGSNYGVQDSFNLFLFKQGEFIRVKGFEELFTPIFDPERKVLTSSMSAPPARGGYVYSEYEWQNNSIVKIKEVTQEVQMVGNTPTPAFLIKVFRVQADGNMLLVNEFVSSSFVTNPGELGN